MDDTLAELLEGNEEDILAKVQAESLRFYKEVELPRLQLDKQISKETIEEKQNNFDDKPSVSSFKNDENRGAILYDGEEAPGFHLSAGSTYVYPTNYPIRQYQTNIVKTAIFKNTLVTLPTGLGKTFIAAVVMYNYYRWYPHGKVVFMAPTRPLVAQQIKACHNIMNIPVGDTTEMTGMINSEQRKILWKEKRVFYLTPQVMVNDLKSGLCPPELVKCIVFDEAHRAVKDYAYCLVVKLMAASAALYRTLALSATPGSDINAVQQVIRNLNITALEIRGEDSLDVAPYTHARSVEHVVVELSPNILRVKEDFLKIYDKYARRLVDNKALTSNISHLTKFQVLKACERFRNNPPRGVSPTVIGSLICDFTVCMSLAHSLDLLYCYGLRAFHSYLKNEGGEKSKAAASRLKNDQDLQRMLNNLGGILYTAPGSKAPYTWGHPKLQQLVATLTNHFKDNEKPESTKVIVFCQYRVVVNEIFDILKKCPNIKPAVFVGQSGGKDKGMTQIKQIQIMKDFREGRLNCLVATCVAEEGLDIGDVDLILLMEIQKSPVRLVQRLGRTGRKRKGRCVVFLTQGKEMEKFHAAMAIRKSYVNNLVKSDAIKSSLCQYSPAMIPRDIVPKPQLVHIAATDLISPAKPVKNKQIDIRNCFELQASPYLSVEQFNELKSEGLPVLNFDKLPNKVEMWHRTYENKMSIEELLDNNISKYSCWNEWNLEKQSTFLVEHSAVTDSFCHLLSLARSTEKLSEIYSDNIKEKKSPFKTPKKIKIPNNENKNYSTTTTNTDTIKQNISPSKIKNIKKLKKDIKTTIITLDIRKFMSGAETIAKPVEKTNDAEIIDLVNDSPIITDISSKNTNDSFIFYDNFFKLINLNNTEISCIYKEKILFESPIFENNHEICSRLDKYTKPKDYKLKYSSIIQSIELPDLDDIINNLNSIVLTEINKKEEKVNNNEFKEEKISQFDFDELVSIDDLLNISGDSDTEDIIKKSINENIIFNNIESPINIIKTPNKNNDLQEIWEDTPDVFKKLNFDDKLFCSTPINNKQSNVLEEKLLNSKKCLVPLIKDEKEIEEGVWNLSDLFESDTEDAVGIIDTGVVGTSTMMTITQIVNDIEKAKINKKIISEDNEKIQKNSDISNTEIFNKEITTIQSTSKETNITLKPNFKKFKKKSIVEKNPISNSNMAKELVKNSVITVNNELKNIKNEKINTKLSSRLIGNAGYDIDDDDDLFEKTNSNFKKKLKDSRINESSPSPIKKTIKKKMKLYEGNHFIVNEADVSGEYISDDSDNSSLDDMDESFINDESHCNNSNNDSHAVYLKSIKSPRGVGGKFKIPINKSYNNYDIFSQQVEQDVDYMNDSFCVATSEEETEVAEISELELAERLLRKKNSKRKAQSSINQNKKRRRIKTPEPELERSIDSSIVEIDNEVDCGIDRGLKRKEIRRRNVILSDSDCDSPLKQGACQQLNIS